MMDTPHLELVRWLRRAHAGELGAALAYRGHALSLTFPPERAHVWAILIEELAHRREAAVLLARCGGHVDRQMMLRIARIGRIAGIACRFSGHVLPMLGAALAEAINVWEYREMALAAGDNGEVAAFARQAATTERDHAHWFLSCCLRHRGAVAALVTWVMGRLEPRVRTQPCLRTSSAVLVTGST